MRARVPSLLFLLGAASGLLAGCASEKPATWDDVGEAGRAREAAFDPAREAREAFTDDACVTRAEEVLLDDREAGHQLMLHCLRRDDFMLVHKLGEPAWKGLKVSREDWDHVIAGLARANTPDAVDLTILGIETSPLTKAAGEGDIAADDLFVVVAVAVDAGEQGGERGLLVRPVVYGTTTRTQRSEETYDIIDRETQEVLEEDVKMVREKKAGVARISEVLEDRYWISLPEGRSFKKGERYVLLVESVMLAPEERAEDAPVLKAHLVAGSPVNPN